MLRVAAKKKKKSLYSVHPGVAIMQKWTAGLQQKTGKSLDQWIAYIRKNGPADEKSRREWLKAEHGLGTNAAWWLAERADENPKTIDDDPEAYLQAAQKWVTDMFA